jgi:hypothetical protein
MAGKLEGKIALYRTARSSWTTGRDRKGSGLSRIRRRELHRWY